MKNEGYKIQQHTPTRACRAILLLYTLGDLRAQGPLQKKSLWLGAFLGVSAGISMLAIFHVASSMLEHPWPVGAISPAVFSLGAFLLLIVNALSVGVLSSTSGKEELQALQYLPMHLRDFIRIRILLSVLRAELVALIFFSPLAVAVAVYTKLSLLALCSSIATLLIFPLVPAAIGTALNLRERRPRLIVWLYALTGSIAVGLLLAQQFTIPPEPFSALTAVMSLPLRSILGMADPLATFSFLSGWLALAGLILWIVTLRFRRYEKEGISASHSTGSILLHRLVWSLSGSSWDILLLLGGIALTRLSLPLILISVISQFTILDIAFLMLPVVTKGGLTFASFIVSCSLTGVCTSIVLICFGPLFTSLLGEAKEHLVLQIYPISARTHAGAIYLVTFALSLLLTAGLTLILLGSGFSSYTPWAALYTVSSLLGGGSLLFVALLNRRPWIKLLGWSLLWIAYLMTKEVGALIGTAIWATFPLLGALLINLLLDGLLCGIIWFFVISNQYKRFLLAEEDS